MINHLTSAISLLFTVAMAVAALLVVCLFLSFLSPVETGRGFGSGPFFEAR